MWVLAARNRRAQEFRRLLDGFPYPGLLFRGSRAWMTNSAGASWGATPELQAIVDESMKSGRSIVRNIPASEGQAYMVRAIPLPRKATLVLLEDQSAGLRQQAFYRNFIQNVSHELKTPLTVIQGHAAKIGETSDDLAGRLASLRIISEESKRLTQLVDNLLTLARLESPSFALETSPMNLSALLEECILELGELAEKRGLAISLQTTTPVCRIRADRARLKQVVLNLLDNAIKYTPNGGNVTVSLVADATKDVVACSVQDTGEGIPAEDLPFVFDKLFRARRMRGRPVEGSGLGLTLAQMIVRAHNGDIRAESEIGKGTTITFSLPLGTEERPQ
jgi:signal transduction histidine kinase